MAQENIASVVGLFKESVGGRFLVVGEVTFPAKYKTEGCELTEKQLQELGLPSAEVDAGYVLTAGKAAKNAEQPTLQFNITKPGVGQSGQKVAIQAYESITTAINKELAAEGTKAG